MNTFHRIMAATALAAASGWAGEGWVPLFNGRDLDGWTPKIRGHAAGEDPYQMFRVEDGVLSVRFDKIEKFDNKFGHLFHRTPYSHYRLRVEYRFVGEQCPGGPGWALRNSGIMIHGQSPETMRLAQNFPVSIEVQLLGGDGLRERTTANLCTPGTHVVMDGELVTRHCTNSRSPTFHGDQWVEVEVEARGSGRIIHRVNGEVVLEYEQPQYDEKDADAVALMGGGRRLIEGGSISLQAESHPVEFRKVEIMVLDPAAPANPSP